MKFLQRVQQCGRWPQQACTTMLFLIPTNISNERPIALLPTLIRWWECLRALVVERWQERHRIGWDVTDRRNGGAERTGWETLLEVERFDFKAAEMNQGAITLVLDLAKAFERVGLPVVWAWATHFNFLWKMDTSSTSGASSLKGASRSRSRPPRLVSLGRSGVDCSSAFCFKMP